VASFEFMVNRSFLHASRHPITIPRSQIAHDELLSLNLDHKDVLVMLPHGERYEAEIYHGTAGYGEYYQIRFIGSSRSLPSYVKLNDQLLVMLEKAAGRSHATLEYLA